MSIISLATVNTPPLNNNMYYKQNNYKYVSGGASLEMPSDAPSGWYEVRVATNLQIQNGMAGMYFLGVVESGTDTSDITYLPDYAPWYASLSQSRGTYVGTPEGSDLYLYASQTSQENMTQDVGFIGYVKHITGISERVATLPTPANPPAVSGLDIGSYVIRQVTQ